MIEHHTQREILDRLTYAPALTFSQLKPAGMENSAFMYHLHQLTTKGLVSRSGAGYVLAPKGLTYVDGLSAQNRRPRQQPKLIAIIALQNSAGQWLLAERKVQPYIGTLMFPSGKRHWGESALEHAVRELYEKTGLREVSLRQHGMADIQISSPDGTLITHAVATVYTGTVDNASLPAETDRFRFTWHAFGSADTAYMPGTQQVHDWLLRSDPANLTLSVQQA